MNIIKEFVYRFRGEYTTEKLMTMGMQVGRNFKRLNGVILDPSHCWLIEIGDNVTMAPRVRCQHKALSKLYQNWSGNHWGQCVSRSGKRSAARRAYR